MKGKHKKEQNNTQTNSKTTKYGNLSKQDVKQGLPSISPQYQNRCGKPAFGGTGLFPGAGDCTLHQEDKQTVSVGERAKESEGKTKLFEFRMEAWGTF